ncbi:aminopeptidase P family protein [Candidatus Thorarchaeota archaeon]|nr:MAG: aminopeptidase P family protein [Candidatus Thorarchaeota archaeon]
MLEEKIYRERIEKTLNMISRGKFDLVILTPSPNFQYIAGFSYEMRERLVALILEPDSEPRLLVPFFEASEHADNTWIEEIITWNEDENPYEVLRKSLNSDKQSYRLLLDDATPMSVYWALQQAFGDFERVDSISPFFEQMRIRKSEIEIGRIKQAGRIIDEAVTKAFSEMELGKSELYMKQLIVNEILELGGQPTFFAVQFGERSAMPHARPDRVQLTKNEIVLIDCGCSIDGYNTDMTRVGIAGEPSAEICKVYDLVLNAEQMAIENLKAGMQCGTADGIARRIIDENGYGGFFTHRLGHGIGLEVHEPPYIVRGNSRELETGMTHSVEPGVYLEGNFGIRIEDLVCIRDDGAEVLTYSPRDLFEIPI